MKNILKHKTLVKVKFVHYLQSGLSNKVSEMGRFLSLSTCSHLIAHPNIGY